MVEQETIPGAEARAFYASALKDLRRSNVPFMIGGAYALGEYADIHRETKDLDIFCKASDYPGLLQALADSGYRTEVTDANWLAKAFHGDHFVDLIFNSHNGLCPVDDSWFDHAREIELFDVPVRLIPPEEEMWTKVYVQDRHRFDGADIYHIIRKMGPELDWARLLLRLEVHWQLLLAHLVNFRFVYPSQPNQVPQWVMDELLSRMREQQALPAAKDVICRGTILSATQYRPDIEEWGYKAR